jgi:2-haloacid dehalogenase
LAHYDFFEIFGGKIVVSGEEKLIKPDPKIWQVL